MGASVFRIRIRFNVLEQRGQLTHMFLSKQIVAMITNPSARPPDQTLLQKVADIRRLEERGLGASQGAGASSALGAEAVILWGLPAAFSTGRHGIIPFAFV
jgi:hypothetical protein